MIQARIEAASKALGVEKGVTGKEKRFQQNRQFGPGAFKPYHGTPKKYMGNTIPIPTVKGTLHPQRV